MRRVVVPLLAAPVALVSLAGSATAIIDPHPEYKTSSDYYTVALCEHPSDERLGFYTVIYTGDEHQPEGADVDAFDLYAVDDGANELFDPSVAVKKVMYSYGILDHKEYVPTSSLFYASAHVKVAGETDSGRNVTDVQAMAFEVIWKVEDDPATRSLSCVVKLDKFNKYKDKD
jgi:hypothetical protein